jgi:hypothetical protein
VLGAVAGGGVMRAKDESNKTTFEVCLMQDLLGVTEVLKSLSEDVLVAQYFLLV